MIHGKDIYNVFVRDWWRKDEHGRIVPYPGAPKRYIARGVSEAEARDRRKAEFESA